MIRADHLGGRMLECKVLTGDGMRGVCSAGAIGEYTAAIGEYTAESGPTRTGRGASFAHSSATEMATASS